MLVRLEQPEKASSPITVTDGGMKMCNKGIREAAKKAGIHLWQVAEACGINDGNFSRKLRRELPQEEKQRILEAIDRLAREKQGVI